MMKKRLLAFFIAVTCLVMPALTSCGKKKESVSTGTKALTVTLYGIKGEGTTDEAIKAVQDELNVYSEGNLTTRVILKLFTEDEYYAKLDEALLVAKEYEEQESTSKGNGKDKNKNNGNEIVFPEEKGAQVDIFMVRGYEMFSKYNEEESIVSLNLTDKSALMRKYIGKDVKVKAAGGISSFDDAEKFMSLGAERLGTSRLVKIMKNADNGAGY